MVYMSRATNSNTLQSENVPTRNSGHTYNTPGRFRFIALLWCIALIAFIASCFVIHAHPKPYSFDLSATEDAQHWHPFASWVNPVLNFPSQLDNPIPAYIALGVWIVLLLLGTLIAFLRRLKVGALAWLLATIFFTATDMASAGINVLVDKMVGRPRPNPHIEPIHVYTPLVPFPTYPSGHTEHDVAYYGFLLYLSFTKPVRRWKYHWLLIPLQLYAIFDILAIGYSRVYLGDHWLTDVLGGYLEGAICLVFFIFLYRLVIEIIERRRAISLS
ncbi:MAG TPA: hypothetical protein DHW02_11370 [Ktedonobacter sp.]|nr:hypothetical protein [Ktedonobacter sp.]